MRRERWYVSTIDEHAGEIAGVYGLGIEIAEYCTAWNMDERFAETDEEVRKKLQRQRHPILHAPFNELFPCSIDPKARILAAERYMQAIRLAKRYGAEKVVIHAGYNPRLYYPIWYTEQSVIFWKEFMKQVPEGITICLENVFEEEIAMFLDILKQVDDSRLKICLDIGHVNAYSEIPATQWIKECAPYISHFHMHNNGGTVDSHDNLQRGSMDMRELLMQIEQFCPDATMTIETTDAKSSLEWLLDEKFI